METHIGSHSVSGAEVTREHQGHRTCSAARARPGCPLTAVPARAGGSRGMLAVTRLQMPAVSLTLLGTVGRNSLSRHCEVSPGAQIALSPFKNHRCTEITKNAITQNRASWSGLQQ